MARRRSNGRHRVVRRSPVWCGVHATPSSPAPLALRRPPPQPFGEPFFGRPRMYKTPLVPCLLALGVALTGCWLDSSTSPPIGYCAAPRSIAVMLDVSDSLSGVGLADSAAGTASTGAYQDSLHHTALSPTSLWSGDQVGSYTVTVQHPAYRDWVMADVAVTQRGLCGNVIPVHLAARLVRAP